MARRDYKRCIECGRHTSEVGPISHSRHCAECGDARLVENALGISEHRGPAFDRWRRACVAAFGGVLLDDLEALIQDGGDAS